MDRDVSRLPALTPESLRRAPPPELVRFALHDAQECVADVSFLINLGGPCLISQGANELWLEEGGATLVSATDACGFTHDPPGDVLTLRCPRAALGSLADRIDDLCLRPIPRETPALGLLRDYVGGGG